VAKCEHEDGHYMGKCAICDDMVCQECFQTLFNSMICSEHEELEDEGSWELVGFYSTMPTAEEHRFFLTEQSLTSIAVESDEDVIELYVPSEEKEEAFAALGAPTETILRCDTDHVFYSIEIGACPICGVGQTEETS